MYTFCITLFYHIIEQGPTFFLIVENFYFSKAAHMPLKWSPCVKVGTHARGWLATPGLHLSLTGDLLVASASIV